MADSGPFIDFWWCQNDVIVDVNREKQVVQNVATLVGINLPWILSGHGSLTPYFTCLLATCYLCMDTFLTLQVRILELDVTFRTWDKKWRDQLYILS